MRIPYRDTSTRIGLATPKLLASLFHLESVPSSCLLENFIHKAPDFTSEASFQPGSA